MNEFENYPYLWSEAGESTSSMTTMKVRNSYLSNLKYARGENRIQIRID
jgi:hypothetical protein